MTRIAVYYHFFPHYRKGVVEQLLEKYGNGISFFSDIKGVEGIIPLDMSDYPGFFLAKSYYFFRFCFQPRVLWSAFVDDFDVVVFLASPNFVFTWIAALIWRIRGRRVVFWGHGFLNERKRRTDLLKKLFFLLSSAHYLYGFRAKKNAILRGFDARVIYVGCNSLDYVSQLAIRKRLIDSFTYTPDNVVKVVAISRLTETCDYALLLEAAKIAQDRGLSIKIEFIGDGPAQLGLKALSARLDVDCIFHGAVYDESVIAKLLFSSDVVVSPGKVGLTAVHSLMYGVPVFTHAEFDLQMPEFESVIPGYTGDFFKKGDSRALSELLINFHRNFPDKALTQQRCFAVVDKRYNPYYQVGEFDRAVKNLTPTDFSQGFNF